MLRVLWLELSFHQSNSGCRVREAWLVYRNKDYIKIVIEVFLTFLRAFVKLKASFDQLIYDK